jgi:hypothetical protein
MVIPILGTIKPLHNLFRRGAFNNYLISVNKERIIMFIDAMASGARGRGFESRIARR